MRNISSNGLAMLAKRLGNEPIMIVEVEWVKGRPVSTYADRDVQGIFGRIVEIGELDSVVDMSASVRSQQLEVTLDDTDGSIKTVFDHFDIQYRTVRVYQLFEGLNLSDKFLVFTGQINTPVSWNERDRTLKFTAVSQIEDIEIGFSAEEGDFQYIPSDLVGKAWPMVFGTVVDYEALKVNFAMEGVTLGPVGILGIEGLKGAPLYLNGTNSDQGSAAHNILGGIRHSMLLNASACWEDHDNQKAQQYLDQANAMADQMGKAAAQKAAQEACAGRQRAQQLTLANAMGTGDNPVQILGGEDFPQGQTLTLDIGGCWFTGYFNGQAFYISDRLNPAAELSLLSSKANNSGSCGASTNTEPYDMSIEIPCDSFCNFGGDTPPCSMREYGSITTTGGGQTPSSNTSDTFFWADAGAKVILLAMGAMPEFKTTEIREQLAGTDIIITYVQLETGVPVTYIASIVPGRVLAVKAFQTVGGAHRLTVVPSELYTIETKTYGTITAVQVVLKQSLSTLLSSEASWDDQLYITFQSDIGPSITDILAYVVENYTRFAADSTSFAYVATKLQPFPANFALVDRKNVVEVLKDIAFQSRCAIWIDDDTVYLRYLPEEPTATSEGHPSVPLETITLSDIDAEEGVEVDLTETERLVTKMKVTWRLGYSPEPGIQAQQLMVLRHNVTRYGLKEQEYNWYIFNQPDIILKMATFWLIRYSQSWKRVKFRCFLNKLNIETFDCVTLDLSGYVASAPVKAIVQKASYNSTDNCIDIECETPVKAGTLVKSPFYWLSTLTADYQWPPREDILSDDAGGGGIGSGASGILPLGFTDTIGGGGVIFVGGPNVVYGPHADWGDRTPSDVGFAAQTVSSAGQYGVVRSRAKPNLDLTARYLRDSTPTPWPDFPTGMLIDISKTKFVDSQGDDPHKYGYLRSFLKLGENQDMVLDLDQAKMYLKAVDQAGSMSDVLTVASTKGGIQGTVNIVTTAQPDGAQFDFRYDTEGAKFGAGTAFLKP